LNNFSRCIKGKVEVIRLMIIYLFKKFSKYKNNIFRRGVSYKNKRIASYANNLAYSFNKKKIISLLEEKSNIILLLDYQLTCLDFKKKDVFKF
jgi:hypothetical protein